MGEDTIMGKALSVISTQDVERIWKLRETLSIRSKEYMEAEYAFIQELYAFAQKYRDSEEALNAELNNRNISTRENKNAYFTKVAKLALAQKVTDNATGEDQWVLEDSLAPEISRYAVLMAGADKTGIPPADLNAKLNEMGKAKMVGEMRKVLALPKDDEGEEDYLLLLSEGVSEAAGELVSQSYTVDREKLGLPVGKVELVGEIDANGKLVIRAIIPADEDALNERLEKIYGERKPLERSHGELFLEILKLSGALPKGAVAAIGNDKNGVNARIIADDKEGRTYAAQIQSPHFDPSYEGDLNCQVKVADIRKCSKLPLSYGGYAEGKFSSSDGKLVVSVIPRGVASLDKAIEAENAGKGISKIKGQPDWVASAELIEPTDGNPSYRKAVFEASNVAEIVSLKQNGAEKASLMKMEAVADGKKARSAKDKAVSISEGRLVFGNGGIHVDNRLLAKAIAQLKALALRGVELSFLEEGLLLEAKNRDYTWTVFLPKIQ